LRAINGLRSQVLTAAVVPAAEPRWSSAARATGAARSTCAPSACRRL